MRQELGDPASEFLSATAILRPVNTFVKRQTTRYCEPLLGQAQYLPLLPKSREKRRATKHELE